MHLPLDGARRGCDDGHPSPSELPDGISWTALIADALSAPARGIPGGRETGASPEGVGDF